MRRRPLFEVSWSHQATGDMERLDHRSFERIESAVDRLAITGQGDVRRLQAETTLRLRVGEWRVLFEQGDETIFVLAVRPRGRAYR